MFSRPTTARQLIAAVRLLAMQAPRTAGEIAAHERACIEMMLHIQEMGPVGFDVPEAVRHFLSDADIRGKDAAYSEAQLCGLSEALSKWERESAI